MVDPSVLRYYGEGSEVDRLVAGDVERLELIRTKELLSRRLGDVPSTYSTLVERAAATPHGWLGSATTST